MSDDRAQPFNDLLRTNRAALHVWENPMQELFLPQKTLLVHLEQQPPDTLKKRLLAKEAAIVSMSLLPQPGDGRAMVPWGYRAYEVNPPAYLFDLRDPRIIVTRVEANAIGSGMDLHHKKTWI